MGRILYRRHEDYKVAQTCDTNSSASDDNSCYTFDRVLLTSKKWRLQSGCNHSTAYVDQWKG